MNFKAVFRIGIIFFTAMNAHAGQYLDYQIKFLQESSIEEMKENDQKAGDYFASLAARSTEESRHMEVNDLPEHWQSASQNDRKPQYNDRLLELEEVIAKTEISQREANAEQIARLQVCLFHARHELSEEMFWNGNDPEKYMECAEDAYKKLTLQKASVPIKKDLPLAKPGECYARVYSPAVYTVEEYQLIKKPSSIRVEVVPAVYEIVETRRQVKEASTRIIEIPAVYEIVEENILIKESSTRISEIPTIHETVEERIIVKEASTRLENIPAIYEWVEEQIIDIPAHTAWKEGGTIVEKIAGTTNKPICLVEVPATYKTIKKSVLKSPAKSITHQIPAVYKIVTKQVVVKPAMKNVIEIPAEFMTIKKSVVKTPAKTKVLDVPAVYAVENVYQLTSPATMKEISVAPEYETVTKTNFLESSKIEWRQVLCDTNLTSDRITRIQKALAKSGHYMGDSWGELDEETLNAITDFQKENELGTGGITLEAVHLLESNI